MNGILAYGDSIVKGIVAENGRFRVCPECFFDLVGQRLQLPTDNRAQMGRTVLHLEKIMKRTESVLSDPRLDTVFLSFGGNDCDHDWQAVSEAPELPHKCKTEPEVFFREYTDRVKQLKAMGKRVLLLSMVPVDPEMYFRWISRERDGDAILRFLNGNIGQIGSWHELYNLAIFRVGRAAGAEVLDISSCLLAQKDIRRCLCEDGAHPNAEGHRLIAEAILSQLNG